MKSVLVSVGQDVMLIPVADLESPSCMRWWGQRAFSAYNPALDACVRRGWTRYYALTHPAVIPNPVWSRYQIILRSAKSLIRRFMFDHPYLTAYTFRFTPIRRFLRA